MEFLSVTSFFFAGYSLALHVNWVPLLLIIIGAISLAKLREETERLK